MSAVKLDTVKVAFPLVKFSVYVLLAIVKVTVPVCAVAATSNTASWPSSISFVLTVNSFALLLTVNVALASLPM